MTGKRVVVFGATGTAGRAAAIALRDAGHDVRAFCRESRAHSLPEGVTPVIGSIFDADALSAAFTTQPDAVVSCLASRSGAPADAWAIDHAAHVSILREAERAGVAHFVLVSAICVQRPKLAFQHAKLAFEAELIASDIAHSIVRPTAFFKSLSGQVKRVRAGKPFLVFGNGELTACKPISDADLGRYLADCLTDPSRRNAVLPIGGPGPAITPLMQGDALFRMLGQTPKFRHVPVGVMDAVITGLGVGGRFSSKLAAKAELARIGRFYATESMLVWDDITGRYDADATPETGQETLFDFYETVLRGEAKVALGDHSVF